MQLKDIPGYQGLYKISTIGQVFSIKSNKFKSQETDKDGYKKITLYDNGRSKRFFVHRLVALTYLQNPQNKTQIDHIDTNRSNNSVNNLRWATRLQNRNNSKSLQNYAKIDYRTNLGKTGKLAKNSKPILCVQLNKVYYGCMQAQRQLGVDHRHIQDVLHGRARRKRAGGYHWVYKQDSLDHQESPEITTR